MHKKTRFLVHSLDGMLVISLFVVHISTFTAAASKLIHHHQHAATLRTVKRRAVTQQTVAIAAQTAVREVEGVLALCTGELFGRTQGEFARDKVLTVTHGTSQVVGYYGVLHVHVGQRRLAHHKTRHALRLTIVLDFGRVRIWRTRLRECFENETTRAQLYATPLAIVVQRSEQGCHIVGIRKL